MKLLRIYFLITLISFAGMHVPALAQPFIGEIRQFRKQDSLQQPPANAILFVGSSSFTMWRDVQDYFPGKTIINRGFGGSSLPHLIMYFDDVVRPYHPKQVVIYCGENDLTVGTIQPHHVLQRFQQLFSMIRGAFPNVPIAYISIKPSPSRQNLMSKMELSNFLVRRFLEQQSSAVYINVYNEMLHNGKPEPSLFIADNLHMNDKGYSLWKQKIEPHLLN